MSRQPEENGAPRAARLNERAMQLYADWELDEAMATLRQAIKLDPDNPLYHLNLARTQARGGSFHDAMQSLANYLRTETEDAVATRYERLFSSALDDVEARLIDGMRELNAPVPRIGKAIQMWLEYRIALGRRPLRIPKPELWSAALCYAVFKINMEPVARATIAGQFGISERSLREKYRELVRTLDLMPGDYRYFTGAENPLDRLIDAAQTLDDIYRTFDED